jgi:hypothetical protein
MKYRVEFERHEIKSCLACPFHNLHWHDWGDYTEGHVYCYAANKEHDSDKKPEWCPLEEV